MGTWGARRRQQSNLERPNLEQARFDSCRIQPPASPLLSSPAASAVVESSLESILESARLPRQAAAVVGSSPLVFFFFSSFPFPLSSSVPLHPGLAGLAADGISSLLSFCLSSLGFWWLLPLSSLSCLGLSPLARPAAYLSHSRIQSLTAAFCPAELASGAQAPVSSTASPQCLEQGSNCPSTPSVRSLS